MKIIIHENTNVSHCELPFGMTVWAKTSKEIKSIVDEAARLGMFGIRTNEDCDTQLAAPQNYEFNR